jgi:hypothetical protein
MIRSGRHPRHVLKERTSLVSGRGIKGVSKLRNGKARGV